MSVLLSDSLSGDALSGEGEIRLEVHSKCTVVREFVLVCQGVPDVDDTGSDFECFCGQCGGATVQMDAGGIFCFSEHIWVVDDRGCLAGARIFGHVVYRLVYVGTLRAALSFKRIRNATKIGYVDLLGDCHRTNPCPVLDDKNGVLK